MFLIVKGAALPENQSNILQSLLMPNFIIK